MKTKRPQIGTFWRGRLGQHQILRVSSREVVVCLGRPPHKDAFREPLKSPPPTEILFELGFYMANQRPNERDEGNSMVRVRARARAGQKDKPLRVKRKAWNP